VHAAVPPASADHLLQSPAVASRPVMILGMHRSGTSLTASLLAGSGIDLGQRLLGAGRGNVRGHFEDLDFQELQGLALRGLGLGEAGYTRQPGIRLPPLVRGRAERLVAERMAAGRPWGWKDPRTVLFLEDWNELLPAAVHIVVFRRPWEVVDSLFRRGDEAFAVNPSFAIDVWLHYNRSLLNFVRRHPDRCAVLEVSQVAADPPHVCRTLRTRWGVEVVDPPSVFEAGLLRVDVPAERAAVVCAYAPQTLETYLALRERAGSASPLPDLPPSDRRRAVIEQDICRWAEDARAGGPGSVAA